MSADPTAARPPMVNSTWKPVEVDGAYVNDKLYYVQETEAKGGGLFRREYLIICSDRQTWRVEKMPAPFGTPEADRVHYMLPKDAPLSEAETKGVHVVGPPSGETGGRWRSESIDKWKTGQFTVRPLKDIVQDIVKYFETKFWLPDKEDVLMLALAIPVTYAMRVFNSVPHVFINGRHGTGKSTIANAMVDLGFNGKTVSATSAATISREVHASKGLLAIDDVERLGKTGRAAAQDSELGALHEMLAASYLQRTAIRRVTDMKTQRTAKLDFYGMKIMTNTEGIDVILASRCIRVFTRPIPGPVLKKITLTRERDDAKLDALRDELYAWSFDNVKDIAATYLRVCPNETDRDSQITAPLKTIAHLTGDAGIMKALDTALKRQTNQQPGAEDIHDVMEAAVTDLVMDGYVQFTPIHVTLQIQLRMGQTYGKESAGDYPNYTREDFITRELRRTKVVLQGKEETPEQQRRLRFRTWPYQARKLTISPATLKTIRKAHKELVIPDVGEGTEPSTFCHSCDNCQYLAVCGDLKMKRDRWEKGMMEKRVTAARLRKIEDEDDQQPAGPPLVAD